MRAHSRNDLDVTVSFPELADIGKFLGLTTCIIDGEIVALGEDGRPSFSRLQQRMHVSNQRGRNVVRSRTLSRSSLSTFSIATAIRCWRPYDERREQLESLHLAGETFLTTDSFRDVSGQDILNATVQNGLEGVVAKRGRRPIDPAGAVLTGRRSSRFAPKRSSWGPGPTGAASAATASAPSSSGSPKTAAALRGQGRNRIQRPTRAPNCSTTSNRSSRRRTRSSNALPSGDAGAAHFVRPELVGEVEFGEWTTAGRLRHHVERAATRQDAAEVVVEQ